MTIHWRRARYISTLVAMLLTIALVPECGAVKLVLYSDKQPEKADTLVVDPNVVQQIWRDFAPYRGR